MAEVAEVAAAAEAAEEVAVAAVVVVAPAVGEEKKAVQVSVIPLGSVIVWCIRARVVRLANAAIRDESRRLFSTGGLLELTGCYGQAILLPITAPCHTHH